MNRKKRNVVTYTAALVIWCLAIQATAQTPLGSGFTYQGKLDLQGSPLDGTATLLLPSRPPIRASATA